MKFALIAVICFLIVADALARRSDRSDRSRSRRSDRSDGSRSRRSDSYDSDEYRRIVRRRFQNRGGVVVAVDDQNLNRNRVGARARNEHHPWFPAAHFAPTVAPKEQFLIIPGAFTFDEAVAACTAAGRKIVSLESATEAAEAGSFLQKNGYYTRGLWIGLDGNGVVWQWSTNPGTAATPMYWDTGFDPALLAVPITQATTNAAYIQNGLYTIQGKAQKANTVGVLCE